MKPWLLPLSPFINCLAPYIRTLGSSTWGLHKLVGFPLGGTLWARALNEGSFIRRSSLFFLVVGMETKKIERKKCPRCYRIEGSQWIPKREVNITMSRLYVKRKIGGKFKWFQVGWICLHCGYVEIEHSELPKVKTYKSPITTNWGIESEELRELERCPTCGEELEDEEKEEIALRWKAITEAYKTALKSQSRLFLE